MPQGISPNPLNKISEVYLSQISEHHKKDADGNTIPHEDELDEAKVDQGKDDASKVNTRNQRAFGNRRGSKGGGHTGDDMEARRYNTEKGRGVKMRGKKDKTPVNYHKRDRDKAVDELLGGTKKKEPTYLQKKARQVDIKRKIKSGYYEEVEVDEAKKPMVKVKLKDPSKIKVKVTDIGPGGKEYVRKNEMDEAMAMKPSNLKKKAKLGAALDRLQALKVAKKKREMGEEIENEGVQYGIFKGDGKPKGAMAAFGKKDKAKKDKKIKMEALSNWKEDYVWEADEEQMEKEVKEKKVKNKIIINPKLGEAVEELGGQLLDVQEMNGDKKEEDPQMKSKMLRQRQLKKQVLLRKLQAVRQTGGEDIVASYEPEGEQLDEYGNPRVGARLRVARAIDKVNPNPKMGSKRTAISNKLKMSAIKAETKRREQKENPYSAGKKVRMALGMSNEDYIPEEGYDIARDMGKIPPTKDKKDATTMPPSKEMEKTRKVYKGPSALDIVKADIRKKYGKGAIMGEAKVDEKTPEHKRATARDKRYGNPHGSLELGGGIRKDRRADHEARRGVKTKVKSYHDPLELDRDKVKQFRKNKGMGVK